MKVLIWQVGLSDAYEHLRSIVPDPEAAWITGRGSSVGGSSVEGGSPPASFSPLAGSSNGRTRGKGMDSECANIVAALVLVQKAAEPFQGLECKMSPGAVFRL